ncbi:hypothetical protein RND81_13G077500 [Saponaria officinalis]|uniref:Homeobox domain-containing protein n=1 Tax=Saponaria officinalis TaxID=3572 RepID=A0AAW1GYR4_SAPOF
MEDHPQNHQTPIDNNNNNNNNNNNTTTIGSGGSSSSSSSTSSGSRERSNNEPVRSRWTPKPEQILILESIFNSGMVNPPKEETVRIRKLLEKFGAVGDANVFYWFQNRRSRSRRRQRQLQASLAASSAAISQPSSSTLLGGGGSNSVEFYDYGYQLNNNNDNKCSSNDNTCTATNTSVVTSFAPSGFCGGVDDVYSSFSGQISGINPLQLDRSCSSTSILCPTDASNLEFHTGIITVFINGVPTQVSDGPVDVKTMFGEEIILVHSSGVPVPFNDFGFSFHPLQHGESYFLVCHLTND